MKFPVLFLCLFAALATPAAAGKVYDAVKGKLVALDGRVIAPLEDTGRVANAKYIALYYGAQDNEACQNFTPILVDFYKSMSRKNRNFDIIFISADPDEFKMEEHMLRSPMQWPAVRYDEIASLPFSKAFRPGAVPHLVLLTADGKLVATNVKDGQVGDPVEVLRVMAGKIGN